MAKELGYEQITGTVYAKKNNGWYEGFFLQASSYGNDFFYINYGVIVPNLWSPDSSEVNLKNAGHILGDRLNGDFKNGTKVEVEKSAELALKLYKKNAVPWFSKISGLDDIASRYCVNRLDEEKVESLSYNSRLSSANYGLLLYLADNKKKALSWLEKTEELMALPIYFTRDGRMVHEREKYSRICKPEDYEIEQLETVKSVIKKIKNA